MQRNRGSSTTMVVVVAAAAAAAVTAAVAFMIARKRLGKKKRNAPSVGKPENLVWNKPLSELPTDGPVPVVDGANFLGEGPFWCSRRQELWWIDIDAKKVMKMRQSDAADGTLLAEGWELPTRPGSLAVREGAVREPDCPLVVGFEDAFSLYNPYTGKRAPAAAPGAPDEYEQLPQSRLNDGRCDRQGRFICGGMNEENHGQSPDVWKPKVGAFRVEGGGGVRRVLSEESFRCYNTTCFSPDGSLMYVSDSPLCKIVCFDYDVVTGAASNKRTFVDMEPEFPDGAAVDSEGCLWVALFGAGEVRRYGTDGNLMRTIKVPGAKQTTCVAFGGSELDILFITSASVGLSDMERLEQPHAGALFAMRLEGVKGLPEPYFLG